MSADETATKQIEADLELANNLIEIGSGFWFNSNKSIMATAAARLRTLAQTQERLTEMREAARKVIASWDSPGTDKDAEQINFYGAMQSLRDVITPPSTALNATDAHAHD